MVFFGQLDRIQAKAVNLIPDASKVLVLGGGTGRLLESFGQADITYIELSMPMIERAKKRKTSASVDFIQIDFMDWQSQDRFDTIICPFFLDLFPSDQLVKVILKLQTHLKPGGQLMVIDFNGKSKVWAQRVLLTAMFFFFYSADAIEIRKYNGMFEELTTRFGGFEYVDQCFGGFVLVNTYRPVDVIKSTS